MSEIIQNIFIIIGFILVAGLGYFMIVQSDPDERLREYGSPDVVSAQFLRQMNVLQTLELDTSVISNQRFQQLRSYRQPVNPLPIGKDNPFTNE